MEKNEKVLVTTNASIILNLPRFNGLTYPEEIFKDIFSETLKNGNGDYIYGNIRELHNRDFSLQENGFRVIKALTYIKKKHSVYPSSIVTKIEIFDTPAGRFAERFCKYGAFYGEIIPVCSGSFDKNGVVDSKGFKFERFDIVIDLDKLYTTDEKFRKLEGIRHDIYTSVLKSVPYIHEFVDFAEDKISFRDNSIGETIIDAPGISEKLYYNPHDFTYGSFVVSRDFSNVQDAVLYFIGYYEGLYRLAAELYRSKSDKSK